LTDQEYDQRLTAIQTLADHFPSAELTANNIKGYVWSLSDLALPILTVAVQRCVATSKFFPTVAEIRENAAAVSTTENDDKHPDSCVCFGTGMIIPERVNGYSPGARRCDRPVAETDPDDMSAFL
jgi:hypothetical protein